MLEYLYFWLLYLIVNRIDIRKCVKYYIDTEEPKDMYDFMWDQRESGETHPEEFEEYYRRLKEREKEGKKEEI